MASSAQAATADIRVRDVSLTDDELVVALMNGRTITVPLAWYPRLLDATLAQRARWELAGAGFGIHWPDVDEDLNTEDRLRGARAPKGFEAWRSRLFQRRAGVGSCVICNGPAIDGSAAVCRRSNLARLSETLDGLAALARPTLTANR